MILTNKKILLIVDNPADRYWYGNQLQESGYEVEVVSGWGKDLHKMDDVRLDLIITELAVPDRDEIITLLELLPFNYSGIPIVIHTAHKDEFTTCGAQAYVRKATDCRQLLDEIKKIIGKSQVPVGKRGTEESNCGSEKESNRQYSAKGSGTAVRPGE